MASEFFSLERGGAARVGRLLARLAAGIGLDADLLALSDQAPNRDFNLSSRTAAGSRADFVFRCWTGGVTHSHFIYNHVGMARAHCVLPIVRRPYAVWMLGWDVWRSPIRSDYGQRIEEASLLLSISDFTRRRAAELMPSAQRAKVCWLATEENDIPEGVKRFRRFSDRFLIITLVDASEMCKGHVELIDCWPSVMAAIPNARLLIAGGGDGLGLVARAGGRVRGGKQYRVHGLSARKARWTRSGPGAHVFAMPSRQEGFGLVYIEAMRRGVPVIASTQDARQEINLYGVTGYNVDLEQEGELARRTIELLSERFSLANLAKTGASIGARIFALARFVAGWSRS